MYRKRRLDHFSNLQDQRISKNRFRRIKFLQKFLASEKKFLTNLQKFWNVSRVFSTFTVKMRVNQYRHLIKALTYLGILCQNYSCRTDGPNTLDSDQFTSFLNIISKSSEHLWVFELNGFIKGKSGPQQESLGLLSPPRDLAPVLTQ